TEGGMVIRQHVSEIRTLGRNTQGVKLIRLVEKDKITGVAAVPGEEDVIDGAEDGVDVDGDIVDGLGDAPQNGASGDEPSNGEAAES
ncbi:MAG: hypothetical protein H7X80_05365, partial [bacterium]|nr:hypothetical protein [Candidatus Kapabacteria bacterium]